ncbi:MAG: energy-coupling factor ABC transporter permease [Gammaproteobacteria bacterium]|nr:energy-coupling factor ABC transporter permease [Gammaproteobacteria bacterium]
MLSAELLPQFLIWGGWLLAFWVLFAVLRGGDWRLMLHVCGSHRFLALSLALALLWGLRANFVPGLSFHLLGVTALTLMLGWRFALLSVALVLAFVTLYWGTGWQTYGVNFFLLGLLPVWVCHRLFVFARQSLPHNFFVYTLFNAFFTAALTSLLVVLTAVSLLLVADLEQYSRLAYEYVPFTPMMLFSEAVFNGLLMTFMVMVKPAWVSSFSDEVYLHGK